MRTGGVKLDLDQLHEIGLALSVSSMRTGGVKRRHSPRADAPRFLSVSSMRTGGVKLNTIYDVADEVCFQCPQCGPVG